jgi:oligoribonuclease (3'-5' exoribonuclease)
MLYDLETENLDPKKSKILEAACMLIDPRTLEIKAKRQFLCLHPQYSLEEDVRRMHTKSGLLRALSAANVNLIEQGTLAEPWPTPITIGNGWALDGTEKKPEFDYSTTIVKGHRQLDLAMADYAVELGYGGNSLTLVGTGIHFDRRFILEHCLHFNAFCHYQMADLRGPLMLYDVWLKRWPKLGKAKHRAMADIEGAHRMLVWLKDQMTGPLSVIDTQELIEQIRICKDADAAASLGLRLTSAMRLGAPEPQWLSPGERDSYAEDSGPGYQARVDSLTAWREALQ